jgi:tetratricopeptide (TPR) repeat protein
MSDTLYNQNLETFRGLLGQTPERAYNTYGLSMFYSLSPREITREKYRLGVRPKTAMDFYNLGVLASQEGRHEEALKLYQQAVEAGGDLPELFFNLGLTHEHLKQKAKAADAYQKFADLSKKDEDEEVRNEIREIRAHIKTLRG